MTNTMAKPAKPTPWRRFPADPADWFSAEEIAKAKAYTTPIRNVNIAVKTATLVIDLVVIGTHLVPNLLDSLGRPAWPLSVFIGVIVVNVIGLLTAVPQSAWQELKHDKTWEFSTQTMKGFVTDQLKGLLLGTVLLSVIFIPVWGLIRWSEDSWWIYAWAFTTLVSVGLGLLFPVLIAPLFNKFTPMEDGELKQALLALARRANADINDVLVSDASRRSRKDNAYVAGMGKTRQVVVFDTMLDRPAEQIEWVVAHEIGHWKNRHLVRMVPLASVMLFVSYAVLGWLTKQEWLLDFAGVDTLSDPGAVPLFLLLFTLPSMFTGLVTSWLARAHERDADLFAYELMRNPHTGVQVMRSLHTDNLADLTPTWWKRVNASHPPAAERMAFGTAWGQAEGLPT